MSVLEYFPFDGKPHRWTMGIRTMKEEEWFQVENDYSWHLKERRKLLQTRHDEVFAALPGSEAACYEVMSVLADHLPKHHPSYFQRQDQRLITLENNESWNLQNPPKHPLECAGLWVQEDLCVMEEAPKDADDSGEYRLTAAVLCFPTRWHLLEKIGRPMSEIHDPIPGYREQINAPVNLFFSRLKVGQPIWRLNWGLNDDANLFQPNGFPGEGLNPRLTEDNTADEVYLRVERQTLSKLPQSGAILFTIRSHQQPLRTLEDRPELAARLAQTLRYWPESVAGYKGLSSHGALTLKYLDQIS